MALTITLAVIGCACGIALALFEKSLGQAMATFLGLTCAVGGTVHFAMTHTSAHFAAWGLILHFGTWFAGVAIGAIIHGPTSTTATSR